MGQTYSTTEKAAFVAAPMLLATMLAACAGSADKALITGGTKQTYLAAVNSPEMRLTDHERAAFNWAVSDLDLATLHRRYARASLRQVVRGEVKRVRDHYPARLADLKAKAATQAPMVAELERVVARDASLGITKGFFGAKPTIRATLSNESTLPLSRVKWRANLYLEGAAVPVASTVVISNFQDSAGLEPGAKRNAEFNIGFVTGDESWTTLEIRNAKQRRVTLTAIPESALDFANKPYLAGDDRDLVQSLEKVLSNAESYSDI